MLVSQRYHHSITLGKKLLIAAGLALALSSCTEMEAVADKECIVYDVTNNTCDKFSKLLYSSKTHECFLVVYPQYTPSINYPIAIAITKIDNVACR